MPKTATRKGVVAGQAPESKKKQVAAATPTDWEAIERKYRAGMLSVREIAKQHGVSDTAIRKKAKERGWTRDLTEKVREQVRTELVRSQVRTPDARTEREIVEEAAAGPVQAVKLHRKDVRAAQELASVLIEQLRGAIGNRDELEEIIKEDTAAADDLEATSADRQYARTRRAQMLKAVSLPGHAATLRDLGTALSKFIPLERQAFNINGPLEEPAPVDEAQAVPVDEALAAFEAKLDKLLSTKDE